MEEGSLKFDKWNDSTMYHSGALDTELFQVTLGITVVSKFFGWINFFSSL